MLDWLNAVLDWLNGNGAALSSFAAIVTAVVAVWALIAAVRDSHERSRPVVVAEFRLAAHNDEAFDLVVRNVGQSIARDVTVTFAPEIEAREDDARDLTSYLVERYADPISAIGPGQELTNVWWSGVARGEDTLVNSERTPEEVTVSIGYKGSSGRKFSDTFHFKTLTMLNTTRSVSSTSFKGRVKSIDMALSATSRSLDKITSTLNAIEKTRRAESRDGSAGRGGD